MILEEDFWRHSARKYTIERIQNNKIREIMNVDRNISETIKKKGASIILALSSNYRRTSTKDDSIFGSGGERSGKSRESWMDWMKINITRRGCLGHGLGGGQKIALGRKTQNIIWWKAP